MRPGEADSIEHLRRYIKMLFGVGTEQKQPATHWYEEGAFKEEAKKRKSAR